MFNSHHVSDIGKVLLQAQEDIAALRGQIGQQQEGGGAASVNAAALEKVLSRAEADLRAKAELVLSAVTQNSAEKLPAKIENDRSGFIDWREQNPQRTPSPYNHYDEYGGGMGGMWAESANDYMPQSSPVGYASRDARAAMGGQSMARPYPKGKYTQPSRTRERLNSARAYEYMRNPTTGDARRFLRERFGIPYAQVNAGHRRTQQKKKKKGKRMSGMVSRRKAALPTRNRMDPAAPPPDISEDDIRGGIMSLVNRGFIPPNVDLSAAFSRGAPPVTQAPVRLHHFDEQFQRTQPAAAPFMSDIANVKLDVAHVIKQKEEARMRALKAKEEAEKRETQEKLAAQLREHTSKISSAGSKIHSSGSHAFDGALNDLGGGSTFLPSASRLSQPSTNSSSTSSSSSSSVANAGNAKGETQAQIEKIRGYNELLDQYSLHQFIIRRGKVLDTTPEFLSFKRTHVAQWGPITTVIKLLEELLSRFSVPMAYIDGHSVVKLSERAELDLHPGPDELIACIANVDQVGALIRLPGRRFAKDGSGKSRASLCIQTCWRRFVCRREYMAYQSANKAASTIQEGWRQAQQYQDAREKIRQRRREDNEAWNLLVSRFRERWQRIKKKRHVVIHLPSLSREEHQRASIPHLQSRINLQMSRLCDCSDPLVDVLYVAPMDVPDDVRKYYAKLLEVGGVAEPDLRFKIVTPENIERFPPHMSLTSLLIYSPRCLRRIRRFIKGRDAYIVPGSAVGPEERRLAVMLGVPLLAPEPSLASQYGLKSGAKRLFATADVSTPPGAHDVYEEPELIGALAKLIAAYIDVPRWLIKLDDEFGGRGHAWIETSELVIVRSLREAHRKHTVREPQYWGRPDVQEGARAQLIREIEGRLEKLIHLNCEEHYPGGLKDFLIAMGRCGAVVEAVPADVRGSPSVNLFISPDGHVEMTSTHDQIFSTDPTRPYVFCGASFPQRSVPHAAIRGASLALGASMYDKGIIGHVGVDFVSFYDDFHRRQRLWAVDLNIGVTRSANTFMMCNFLLQGKVETSNGEYMVEPLSITDVPSALEDNVWTAQGSEFASNDSSSAGGSKTSEAATTNVDDRRETRSYVAIDCLYHPNLGAMQYGAFFNLCRLHGVSFDLQQRMGTAFMLTDSLAAGIIGILGVGCGENGTQEALKTISKALRFIESQVGSMRTQGEFDSEKSNFTELSATIKTLVAADDSNKVGEGKKSGH